MKSKPPTFLKMEQKPQSQNGQTAVNVKLIMGGVTKKIKDKPNGLSALRELVKAHLVDGADKALPEFTIEYQDEDQDNIAILDDDDLQLAYEWAAQQATTDLKLIINTKKQKKGSKKYDPFAKEPQETPTDEGNGKPRRGKKFRHGDEKQESDDKNVEFTAKPWKNKREKLEPAQREEM